MNQASKSTARAATAPHILIVEDDSDLTLLLSYNLEAEGYTVESLTRGDEADLRLTESAPDLVILDWMLPGLSGIEICRRLRAREETSRLPVIMVTGRSEESERVRGLLVGADDYVVKPVLGARVDGASTRAAQAQRTRADRRAPPCRGTGLQSADSARSARAACHPTSSDGAPAASHKHKFAPDGHLVGSIDDVIAGEALRLTL